MLVGERIKMLREQLDFSQGEVEKRTGLLRCYTSRVENGHTVPSLETLGKYAQAFGVELWQLLADPNSKPKPVGSVSTNGGDGEIEPYLKPFRHPLSKLSDAQRKLVLTIARRLVSIDN